MGDLPNLPPGCDWRTVETCPGAVDLYAGGVCLGWRLDDDDVAHAADTAHDLCLIVVHAAITDTATAAGVVLPEGFDVGVVLRDGVRAHGWWWRSGRPMPDGRAAWDLWMGEHRFAGFIVDGGTWSGNDAGGGVAPSNEAAALALWEAVGPEGLPMPPLPEDP